MRLETALLPPQFAYRKSVSGGEVRQLDRPARTVSGDYEIIGRRPASYGVFRCDDGEVIWVTAGHMPAGASREKLLRCSPALMRRGEDLFRFGARVVWELDGLDAMPPDKESVLEGLSSSFRFAQENKGSSGIGLRPPQIGALYAVLGHWTVSSEPATVIMPTGTGKTETMLALFSHSGLERLLVLVPNAALREQTVGKFMSLGLLRELGIISKESKNPVVGSLEHELQTPEAVDELFGASNVVVGTMQAMAGCSESALSRVVELTTHLFIDEAHHIAAPSWASIKSRFRDRPVVQFTATPYRRDGKRVDGKPIFDYPLGKAQAEGYFKPIRYTPVFEFTREKGDAAIVQKALNQLRDDLANGFDHLIMARCQSIQRAQDVMKSYMISGAEFHPQIVHSKMRPAERRDALAAMRTRQSRVILCVDMLGEGFDLPHLKIAALHDVHKSLAITLQFTGRFTRSAGASLGDATMVANAAFPDVSSRLQELYSEDSDWNQIIRKLGEEATGQRLRQSAFLDSFSEPIGAVPVQNILPKMSTVVYKTECDTWSPHLVAGAVEGDKLFSEPSTSSEHNCVFFVLCEKEGVPWGDLRQIQNTNYDLYLLHWDSETKLLYINSSNNSELHHSLAQAVCGDVKIIDGETVYRALYNIKRLILITLGLSHAAGRAIRFTGHFGSDIAEMLSATQLASKTKTNLFGRGYFDGERTSIGCSRKGRIWSHKQAHDLSEWVEWCHSLGAKLIDDGITPEEILRGILKPSPVSERPRLVPLAIDWSHRMYQRSEDATFIRIGENKQPFYECELSLSSYEDSGPIRFKVHTESLEVEYEIAFRDHALVVMPITQFEAFAVFGQRSVPLSQLFKSEPPVILFEKDTFIEDNLLFHIERSGEARFDRESIDDWDWTGTDLSKESQRDERRADSIQWKVIQKLLEDDTWDLVFDDDEAGESADVVAVRRNSDSVTVRLHHCKWAIDGSVGIRVKDLYEVCGQAQKSVRWRDDVENFFSHLRFRETRREVLKRPTRLMKGDSRLLMELLVHCRYLKPKFEIAIVQPGLSKTNASLEQLELLGATQLYLQESLAIPLHVISSP